MDFRNSSSQMNSIQGYSIYTSPLTLKTLSMDEKLLSDIIKSQKERVLDLILIINGKSISLKDSEIVRENTPVSKTTKRGGIYFSGTKAFKIKATTDDLSLIPLLSKSMLGPNTEFKELKLKTKLNIQNQLKEITFFAYLTNTIQSSSILQLNMTITRIETN